MVLWTSHFGVKSLGPTHNLSRLWHANPGMHHHWFYVIHWLPSSPPSLSLCYIKFFYKKICLNKNKKLTPCHLSPCSLAGHHEFMCIGVWELKWGRGWSERLTYNAGAVTLLGGRSRRNRRAKVLITLATSELESAVTWESFLVCKNSAASLLGEDY